MLSRISILSLDSLVKVRNVDLRSISYSPKSFIGLFHRKIGQILSYQGVSVQVSTFGSDSANQPTPYDHFKKLKSLDRVHVNQTRLVNKTQGKFSPGGISMLEFEVLDKNNEKLFHVHFQRGDVSEDYSVKVFPAEDDKTTIAYMYLEPDLHLKNLIYPVQTLRINSPPGNHIGNMYELKGISKVAIMETETHEPLCQILTDGGRGWTTSAKILTPAGDKKVGNMFKMKAEAFENFLRVTINFPHNFELKYKVSLIGACLILMGKPR